MGRSPCCDSDANVKKGPWTTEEDEKLREYIEENGAGNWRNLPKLAGLNRCGKSCRLRWANYLRPDIKRGRFSDEEEQLIIHSHSILGNKWSAIAARLPGRTDNEIKNYWNTHLRKKLLKMGIDPVTHAPRADLNLLASIPNLIAVAMANPLINALQFPQVQLLQSLIQVMQAHTSPPNMAPLLDCSTLGLQNQDIMALQTLSNNLLDTCINGSTEVVAPMDNYGGISSSTSYVTNETTTPTPTLVSASPENSFIDQVQEPAVNSSNIAISSPTSKPFDAWDGLNLDDLDTDVGWKDILNQISWSGAL